MHIALTKPQVDTYVLRAGSLLDSSVGKKQAVRIPSGKDLGRNSLRQTDVLLDIVNRDAYCRRPE
jgi:hypothetical protein